MSAVPEEVKVIEDCSNSDVVTKYKMAAEIADCALQGVLSQAIAGKDVAELCKFGDALVSQRVAAVFKNKKIEKGVAFPTCVSVNETICHFSPLPSESRTLMAGDWIKIDIGCHIDGYIAVTATTHVVGQEGISEPETITGESANVMVAAHQAVELCTRLIKDGNTNTQVTTALQNLAEDYGVKAVTGTIMHQLKRFVIDANKTIAQKFDPEVKTDKITFETNEVYAIDIVFTTGLEKALESEARTTVFKRAVERTYRLKMKSSRYVFNEINQKCSTLPFSLRAFEDERQARMGVVECVKHGLVTAYPVLHVRPEDKVVHLKATVLLLPSGTDVITCTSLLPLDKIQSEKQPREELATILNQEISKKSTKKKSKKSKKQTTTVVEETMVADE